MNQTGQLKIFLKNIPDNLREVEAKEGKSVKSQPQTHNCAPHHCL